MEHEHKNGSISKTARLRHRRHQGLFFLIIQMTWCRHFLPHQLDHLCRVMLDVPCTHSPCKVPLETDEGTIDRVRLEVKNLLQVATVVGESWGCHAFWSERACFLSSLAPDGFTPSSKVTQVAEIVANGGHSEVLFRTKPSLILCDEVFPVAGQYRSLCSLRDGFHA